MMTKMTATMIPPIIAPLCEDEPEDGWWREEDPEWVA